MNLQFSSIDIQNFRSIKEMKVDLSNQGIVIVKGVNEYEDKATSNGSGKSSVFESIIFALFEETSNGEKDVSTRGSKEGYNITLRFNVDGIPYVINRKAKGKSVSIYKDNIDISARTKSETNKIIQSVIGINKSIFLDSIFLSQNANTNLATLSPTARRERLEILTNTDYTISLFKEKLKELQQEYESMCVSNQLELNKLTGKLETIDNQKYKIQTTLNEIEEKINERNKLGNIEEIQNQIDNLNNEITNLSNKIPQIDTDVQSINEELELLRNSRLEKQTIKDTKSNEIENQRTMCNDIQKEITRLDNIIHYNLISMERLNNEIEKIKNSDTCPTCGRKYENVNEEHIMRLIEEKQLEINNLQTENDNTNKQIIDNQTNLNTEIEKGKLMKEEIDSITQEINTIDIEIQNKEKEVVTLNNQKTQILQNIQLKNNSIANFNNMITEIKNIEIPDKTQYESMLNDLCNEEQQIKNNETTINEDLNKYNTNVEVLKHSVQLVTKEFRTYLLKNSLQYLNSVLKKYSTILFSNEKDVIFISEDDTKLDIYLGDASYESLSGGERTRVDIALLLAQKSLANMIGNISCNIIILDEVLGYCDAQAESVVVNLLCSELNTIESIYMISHKEIPIGYDKEMIIVKNKQGESYLRSY